MNKIGTLLLAAGESKRMGKPKQLLDFEGKMLLEHACDELKNCGVESCTIVLGAYSDLIQTQCNLEDAEVIVNPNWKEGMGSSIAFGMQHLMQNHKELTHVLIALVDQPYLIEMDYGNLVFKAMLHPAKIIASFYAHQIGAPMIFPRSFFEELSALKGDEGARKIARGQMENVRKAPIPRAAFDWDRPEDVEAVLVGDDLF